MSGKHVVKQCVYAFLWDGIADLDDLISWVEAFGDDFETWFTLGGQEEDPNGPLFIRIPGATIYDISPGEYIVRNAAGEYIPVAPNQFHKIYKKNDDYGNN